MRCRRGRVRERERRDLGLECWRSRCSDGSESADEIGVPCTTTAAGSAAVALSSSAALLSVPGRPASWSAVAAVSVAGPGLATRPRAADDASSVAAVVAAESVSGPSCAKLAGRACRGGGGTAVGPSGSAGGGLPSRFRRPRLARLFARLARCASRLAARAAILACRAASFLAARAFRSASALAVKYRFAS